MAEKISIATVFYRTKPTADFQVFRFVIEQLLAQGVEVHCICSKDMKFPAHPNLVRHHVRVPTWIRRAWYARVLFEFVSPLLLIHFVRKMNCRLILSTKSEWSFLSVPAKWVTGRPLVTYIEVSPWVVRRSSRRSRWRRMVGLLCDYLGLCSSTRIIASGKSVAEEIAAGIPFVKDRITALEPRALFPPAVVRQNGALMKSSWTEWMNNRPARRKELGQSLDIPDRWLCIGVPVEMVERIQVETVLRAFSSLENERIALIFYGYIQSKNFIRGIAVGLGLESQVVFYDGAEEERAVIGACDLFIIPMAHGGGSRMFGEALGSGAAVIGVSSAEAEEILQRKELQFEANHVEKSAQRLREALEEKNASEQIRRLSRDRALEISGDWGEQLSAALFK